MPEDGNKRKKQAVQTAKELASTTAGVAKTFITAPEGRSTSEHEIDYGEGPAPKPKTLSPPSHWYKDSPDHKIPEMPSYKEGTNYVPKTGPAILHKGEAVIPKEQNMAKVQNPSLYRAMHHLNKGGLHRALGVPEGQTIPADKLEAAKNSKNSHVAHMAHFAATMKGFKH